MPTPPTHTPTPWKVIGLEEIWGADEKLVADMSRSAYGTDVARDANAAYIVRACNGVDAVLKTGDALLEKIGMVTGIETERKAFIEALRAISND